MTHFDLLILQTARNLKFLKSKMAATAILEKSRNRHISATVGTIAKKFGMMTHFEPLERSDR